MMISTEILATITLLDGDGALSLISAILAYQDSQKDSAVTKLTGKAAILWPLVKSKLDEQIRQEAAIRQRQEAGQASVRKRWGNEPCNEPYNESGNETRNETRNEMGNEMGNGNGNGSGNESGNETCNGLNKTSSVATLQSENGSISINNIYNNTTPITTKEREKEKIQKEKKRESDAAFDLFWAAYPRKQSKSEAVKAWGKLQPDEQLLDRILFALEWQTQSDEWRRENGKFIPYPSTWLNGRRWEDEPPQKRPIKLMYAPQDHAAQTTRTQQFAKLEAAALEPLEASNQRKGGDQL